MYVFYYNLIKMQNTVSWSMKDICGQYLYLYLLNNIYIIIFSIIVFNKIMQNSV